MTDILFINRLINLCNRIIKDSIENYINLIKPKHEIWYYYNNTNKIKICFYHSRHKLFNNKILFYNKINELVLSVVTEKLMPRTVHDEDFYWAHRCIWHSPHGDKNRIHFHPIIQTFSDREISFERNPKSNLDKRRYPSELPYEDYNELIDILFNNGTVIKSDTLKNNNLW